MIEATPSELNFMPRTDEDIREYDEIWYEVERIEFEVEND